MNKKTGATVIYDKNPHTLVKKLLTEINKRRKIDEQID